MGQLKRQLEILWHLPARVLELERLCAAQKLRIQRLETPTETALDPLNPGPFSQIVRRTKWQAIKAQLEAKLAVKPKENLAEKAQQEEMRNVHK